MESHLKTTVSTSDDNRAGALTNINVMILMLLVLCQYKMLVTVLTACCSESVFLSHPVTYVHVHVTWKVIGKQGYPKSHCVIRSLTYVVKNDSTLTWASQLRS